MDTKTFCALSEPAKRVAIARDTIEQLAAMKITAKTGVYVQPLTLEDGEAGPCYVCALGGMFLSMIRLSGSDIEGINGVGIHSSLGAYFQDDDLDNIEEAFEERWMAPYPDVAERLTAIMKNVIDNDGEFDPVRFTAR